MKIAVIAIAVMLAGCQLPATAQVPPSLTETLADSQAQADKQMRRLAQGLQSLQGQNIRVAANLMGYPQSQRESLGDTLYMWSSYMTFPATQYMGAMTFSCTIEIAVDAMGTIKTTRWWNNGGCNPYANMFPITQ